ncbi:flagellar hook-associated protein FlgL [Dyella nitratireducens]|uniref:Flagellar hook-associated protein 3 n=1 Tax=Dyella nitratireducens TaxID=1849580 RepID=A0ABQ1FTF1_9GAMM|nr:flagellar hook-associated protein FlgL [Dyella nitratireducens]GGA27729.1 flagellar hook-associated protein 3 [Dyella nitratireducens]GLQ43375.1 flagellar hook-associated protein 3 [Dyella nitratireducens]
MRISTAWMYQQQVNTMLDQQSALAQTQNEISTGYSINVASDNPTGAAQVVQLNHILAENTQYTSNINAANTRLSTESSTLTTVNNLLSSVNDIALGAINGAMSSSDLSNMATQLTQYRDQLVQLANTTDGNGQALFTGTSTTNTPFVTNSSTGAVTYAGNDQQSFTAVGGGLQVASSDSGSDIFMNLAAGNGSFVSSAGSSNTGTLIVGSNSVTNAAAWSAATASGPVNDTITFGANGTYSVTDAAGNPVTDSSGNPVTGTYTDGGSISFNGITINMSGTPNSGDTVKVQSDSASNTQDVFTTLNNMITALQSGGSSTSVANTLNRQLESLNQAMNSVSNAQVSVGSRIDTLQQQSTSYSDLSVTYKSALSDVQDVDMATAISNLSLQSTALQASQQVFAKIQGTSLFDYIR